ncbi:MAG: hypothetical protein AB1720_02185 [Pseudomonadota bacterium]
MRAVGQERPIKAAAENRRCSAKGATGLLTYYIRCTRKTGR